MGLTEQFTLNQHGLNWGPKPEFPMSRPWDRPPAEPEAPEVPELEVPPEIPWWFNTQNGWPFIPEGFPYGGSFGWEVNLWGLEYITYRVPFPPGGNLYFDMLHNDWSTYPPGGLDGRVRGLWDPILEYFPPFDPNSIG